MTKKKREEDLEKRGRKTIITPEIIIKLEQAFMYGFTDLQACLFAEISKTTFYNFQNKHPEFVDRKELLRENLALRAKVVLAKKIQNEDEETAKWYLERKCKKEFSTRQEITGEDGEPLAPVINIMPISSDKKG